MKLHLPLPLRGALLATMVSLTLAYGEINVQIGSESKSMEDLKKDVTQDVTITIGNNDASIDQSVKLKGKTAITLNQKGTLTLRGVVQGDDSSITVQNEGTLTFILGAFAYESGYGKIDVQEGGKVNCVSGHIGYNNNNVGTEAKGKTEIVLNGGTWESGNSGSMIAQGIGDGKKGEVSIQISSNGSFTAGKGVQMAVGNQQGTGVLHLDVQSNGTFTQDGSIGVTDGTGHYDVDISVDGEGASYNMTGGSIGKTTGDAPSSAEQNTIDITVQNHGTFQMSDGEIGLATGDTAKVTVGENGTFTQSGGTNRASVTLNGGEYNLSKGTVGGSVSLTNGTMSQSGGAVNGAVTVKGGTYEQTGGTVNGSIAVSESGTYNLSAGSKLGGDAHITVSGGTLNVKEATGAKLNLTMTGGTTDVSTGNITEGSTLTLQSGNANLTLSHADASITGSKVTVGSGTTLTQTNGEINGSTLDITGTFTMNGGSVKGSGSKVTVKTGGSVTQGADATVTDTEIVLDGGSYEQKGSVTGGSINLKNGTYTQAGTLTDTTVTQTGGIYNQNVAVEGDVNISAGTYNQNAALSGNVHVSGAASYLQKEEIVGGVTLSDESSRFTQDKKVQGDVTVDNGTYTQNADGTITGKVTMNGGTFKANGSTDAGVLVQGGTFTQGNGTINGEVKVTGKGATFTQQSGDSKGAINGAVKVEEGGAFTLKGSSSTVSGGVSLSGDSKFTLEGGTIHQNVDVNGGTFTQSGGALANKLNLKSGTYTLSGGSIADVEVSNGSLSISGSAEVSGTLTVASLATGSVQQSSGSVSKLEMLGGTYTATGGTIGSVNMRSGGAKGRTFTLNGATVEGDVAVSTRSTFTLQSGTVGGAVNVSGGKVTQSGGTVASGSLNNGDWTLSGENATITGSLNLSNGTFNQTGAKSSVGSVTQSGGTYTAQSGKIAGDVAITGGTFTQKGTAVSGGVSVSGANSKIALESGTVGGELSATNGGTVTQNGGTVASGSLNGGNWTLSGENAIITGDLTLSNGTFIQKGANSSVGSVTQSSGTYALQAGSVKGNVDVAGGTFKQDGGTVASGSLSNGSWTLGNAATITGSLTLSGEGVFTQAGTSSVGSVAQSGGNYTAQAGSVKGDVNITGGTFSQSGATVDGSMTVDGSSSALWLNAGQVKGSVSAKAGAKVTQSGAGVDGDITVDGSTYTYHSGTLKSVAVHNGGSMTAQGVVNADGGIILDGGTLTLGAGGSLGANTAVNTTGAGASIDFGNQSSVGKVTLQTGELKNAGQFNGSLFVNTEQSSTNLGGVSGGSLKGLSLTTEGAVVTGIAGGDIKLSGDSNSVYVGTDNVGGKTGIVQFNAGTSGTLGFEDDGTMVLNFAASLLHPEPGADKNMEVSVQLTNGTLSGMTDEQLKRHFLLEDGLGISDKAEWTVKDGVLSISVKVEGIIFASDYTAGGSTLEATDPNLEKHEKVYLDADLTLNTGGQDVTLRQLTGEGHTLTITGTGTVALENKEGTAGNTVLTGNITSTEAGLTLAKTGGGNLTVTGGNLSLAGKLDVRGGKLVLEGNGNQVGVLALGDNTTLELGAEGVLTVTGDSTLNTGTLTGAGKLVLNGSGATTLGGGLTLNVGTLEVASGTVNGNTNITGNVVVRGGTLTIGEKNTVTGDVSVTGGEFRGGAGEISGSVGVSGGKFIGGAGTIGGGVSMSGGTFQGGAGAITGHVDVTGGAFTGGAGAIGGGVGVSKEGAFTAGKGTITGNVDVSGGTFQGGSAGGTISGDVKVSDGEFHEDSEKIAGHVDVTGGKFTGGAGTIGGGVSVGGQGTFTAGQGAITGNVDVSGGAFQGGAGTITGNVAVTGGAFTGGTGAIDGGVSVSNKGAFTAGQGTITGNVDVSGGTFTGGTAGGTISGDVKVSGGEFLEDSEKIAGHVDVAGGKFTGGAGTIGGGVSVSGQGAFTAGQGAITGNVDVKGGSFTANGAITGNVGVSAGTFTGGAGNIDGNVDVSGGNFTGGTGTISGDVTLNAQGVKLNKTGYTIAGKLILSGDNTSASFAGEGGVVGVHADHSSDTVPSDANIQLSGKGSSVVFANGNKHEGMISMTGAGCTLDLGGAALSANSSIYMERGTLKNAGNYEGNVFIDLRDAQGAVDLAGLRANHITDLHVHGDCGVNFTNLGAGTLTFSGNANIVVVGSQSVSGNALTGNSGTTTVFDFAADGGTIGFAEGGSLTLQLANELYDELMNGQLTIHLSDGSFADVKGDVLEYVRQHFHLRTGDGLTLEGYEFTGPTLAGEGGIDIVLGIATDNRWVASEDGEASVSSHEFDHASKVVVDQNLTVNSSEANAKSTLRQLEGSGNLTLNAEQGKDMTVTLFNESLSVDGMGMFGDTEYQGNITSTGAGKVDLVKDGNAELNLIGNVTINGGLTVNDGKLDLNGQSNSVGTLSMSNGENTNPELAVNGSLSVKEASTLNGGTLSGSGEIVVEKGLTLGGNLTLGDVAPSMKVQKDATLRIDSTDATLGGLSGAGDVVLSNTDVLTLNDAQPKETPDAFSGKIEFAKGSGTLRMDGYVNQEFDGVRAQTVTLDALSEDGNSHTHSKLSFTGNNTFQALQAGGEVDVHGHLTTTGNMEFGDTSRVTLHVDLANTQTPLLSAGGNLSLHCAQLLLDLTGKVADPSKDLSAVLAEGLSISGKDGAAYASGTRLPLEVSGEEYLQLFYEDLYLTVEGEAPATPEVAMTTAEGDQAADPGTSGGQQLVLHGTPVSGEDSPWRHAAGSHNSSAGVALLVNAILAGARSDVFVGVRDSIAHKINTGDVVGASRIAAAIAGSTVTAVSSAVDDGLRDHLLRMRGYAQQPNVKVDEGKRKLHFWVTPEVNFARVDADGDESGYDMDSWGGNLGADMKVLNEDSRVGLALSASYGDLDANASDSADGSIDSYYLSLYTHIRTGKWLHTGILALGTHSADLDRTVNYDTGVYHTNGSTDAFSAGLFYELAYDVKLDKDGKQLLQPHVQMMLRHTSVSGWSEGVPGGMGLNVDDSDATTFTLAVGTRWVSFWNTGAINRSVRTELGAAIAQDFGDTQPEADVALQANPGFRHAVRGSEAGNTSVQLSAGVSVPVSNTVQIFLNASSTLRADSSTWGLGLGVRASF